MEGFEGLGRHVNGEVLDQNPEEYLETGMGFSEGDSLGRESLASLKFKMINLYREMQALILSSRMIKTLKLIIILLVKLKVL